MFTARRAFSLLEVLVASGIVALLLVVVVAAFGPVRTRAEQTRCMANMRALHTALSAYVQDRLHWPQQPESEVGAALLDEDWWLAELKPYGADLAIWTCPAIRRLGVPEGATMPRLHYSPTDFDERPFAPYEFATQPWLIEIGSAHPGGANICFPDGSIRPLSDFLQP